MMILDSTVSDWQAFTANIRGLSQILAQRGGIAAVKWKCFFRTHLTWARLRGAAHTATKKSSLSQERSSPALYPTHPYSPSLWLKLSNLPVGLSEVAASGGLSIIVIEFSTRMYDWTRQFNPYADECGQARDYYANGLNLISTLADILAKYALRPFEWILCTSLYAYINSTDGRKKLYRQPRGLEDLLTSLEHFSSQTEMNDTMLWVAMVIASNNDNVSPKARERWYLLDRYLDQPQALWSWEPVLIVTKKFFWTTALEDQWRNCWRTALQRKGLSRILSYQMSHDLWKVNLEREPAALKGQ